MATAATARREMETQLIQKAWKDPDFRAQVVRNPKGMLEQYLGQKLPEQVKIFVHEEDAQTMHFSLPPAPSNMAELSDEDLEKVAGGTEIVISLAVATPWVVVGVSAAASVAGSAIGTAAGVTKGSGGW